MPKTSKVKKKVSKTKAKAVNKSKVAPTIKSGQTKAIIKISKNYTPKENEKYMCEKHKIYFRIKLQDWKKELINSL